MTKCANGWEGEKCVCAGIGIDLASANALCVATELMIKIALIIKRQHIQSPFIYNEMETTCFIFAPMNFENNCSTNDQMAQLID